jgi:hypothetical protein
MQEWEKILYREVGYQESGKPCVPVFMFWVWVYTNTEMVWDNRSHQNANIFSLAPKMRRSTWVENASSHNNVAHQQLGMPARIKVLCWRWEESLANSVVVVAVLTAQPWATAPE